MTSLRSGATAWQGESGRFMEIPSSLTSSPPSAGLKRILECTDSSPLQPTKRRRPAPVIVENQEPRRTRSSGPVSATIAPKSPSLQPVSLESFSPPSASISGQSGITTASAPSTSTCGRHFQAHFFSPHPRSTRVSDAACLALGIKLGLECLRIATPSTAPHPRICAPPFTSPFIGMSGARKPSNSPPNRTSPFFSIS